MKFSVVGCEASGKTVFMSALADYYGSAKALCLVPENPAANKFSRFQYRQLRRLRTWPAATKPWRTVELEWSLRFKGEKLLDVSMLEFGGETFRAAFRDEESDPAHKASVKALMDNLRKADFIVVLVSLKELFRDPGTVPMEEFERDTESLWVTRGLIEFAKEKLPGTEVIIALSQADRYHNELEALGGAEKAFAARWPTVQAAAPGIKVVELASISATDEAGNPAENFKTDGVLSVMHELASSVFGDPFEKLGELSTIAQSTGQARARAKKFAAVLHDLECSVAITGSNFDKPIAEAKAKLEELKEAAKNEKAAAPVKAKRGKKQGKAGGKHPVVRRVWLLALLLAASVALLSVDRLCNPVNCPAAKQVTQDTQDRQDKVLQTKADKLEPAAMPPQEPETNKLEQAAAVNEQTNKLEQTVIPQAPETNKQEQAAIVPEPASNPALAAVSQQPTTNLPPLRVWHDHKGNAITARWQSTSKDGKSITIETEKGRRIRAVLHKFSEEDRAYIDAELHKQTAE